MIKTDYYYKYSVLAVLAAGIIYAIMTKKYNLIMPSLVIIIPIFASFLWMTINKKNLNYNTVELPASPSHTKNIILIYIFIYTISLLTAFNSTLRPLSYFILFSSLSLLILYLILSDYHKNKDKLILILIISTTVNLSLTTLFKYKLYFAGGDTLSHLVFSKVTLVTGHIIPSQLELYYAYFPCYHILTSIISQTSNIDIMHSLFLLVLTNMALILVFSFCLFRALTHNNISSLLGVFFLSLSPTFIYNSSYAVARNLVFLFFIMFLFILASEARRSFSFVIIQLLISLFIVVAHSISIAQFILILILFGIIEYIFRRKVFFRKSSVLILIVYGLAYWFYLAISVPNSIIEYLILASTRSEYSVSGLSIPPFNLLQFYKDHINIAVNLFFINIGVYKCLRKISDLSIIAIASLCFLVFYVPNPIKDNAFIQTSLGFYRFEFFVIPFISIIIAIGFITFFIAFTKGKNLLGLRAFLIYIVCFAAVLSSATTEENASDLSTNSSSRYFILSDTKMLDFIQYNLQTNASMYSDYFVTRYFEYFRPFKNIENYNLRYYNINDIANIHDPWLNNSYIVYRNGEFKERGRLLIGHSYNYDLLYNNTNSMYLNEKLGLTDKIYGVGRNEIYYCASGV